MWRAGGGAEGGGERTSYAPAPGVELRDVPRDGEWLLDEEGRGALEGGAAPTSSSSASALSSPRGGCRTKWAVRLAQVTLACAGVWTFATFVIAFQTRVCWTARDELELLNKFNAVSFLEGEGPWPLGHAHSHNDYVNPKPLGEALSAGFCSVEGDVHLLHGELWLGHLEAGDTKLVDVYVAPLVRLARKFGTVFKRSVHVGTCQQVYLLVDFKSMERMETYRALDQIVRDVEAQGPLPDGRSVFQLWDSATGKPMDVPGSAQPSPLVLILTGINDDRDALASAMLSEPVFRAKLDLADVPEAGTPLAKVAGWASVKWPFPWPPPSEGERDATALAIRARVKAARERGMLVRYWNTPESPQLWDLLLDAGVDLLNTDRIFTLHSFLAGKSVNVLDRR